MNGYPLPKPSATLTTLGAPSTTKCDRHRETSGRFRPLLRTLFLACICLLPTEAWAQTSELFQLAPEGKARLQSNPAASEAWHVAVDASALAVSPKRLTLPLPDGRQIVARETSTDRRSADNLAWRATLSDGGYATLTLAHGYVIGRIETATDSWELTSHKDGGQVLIRLDPEGFGSCGNQFDHGDPISVAPPTKSTISRPVIGVSRLATLDVMVLYTPQARAGAGGQAAIESTAQSAVDSANTAFINSDINLRFNLVHTELADRNDAGSADANLDWLNDDPTVQALRDVYQADLVSLLLEDAGSNLCGLARLLRNQDAAAFASSGYQITRRDCAVGNLTYVHEHGHNIGLQHDPVFATPPGEAFRPYAFGHFSSGDPNVPIGAFRTVMALPSSLCPGCPRRSNFSNPDVAIFGEDTGIANERDNARTADISGPIAANWRPRFPAPKPCADCIDFVPGSTLPVPGQDSAIGPLARLDDGATLGLGGDRWQRTTQTFTITPHTILELEFASTAEGEIHGIGFDEDDSVSNNPRLFQLFGSESSNNIIQDFATYTSADTGSFVRFTIPVGQYYTGSGFRLVFANDQDGSPRNNTSFFRNVRVFDQTPSVQPTTGLWWNPARSGNGFDLVSNNSGGHVLTWFTYTASGTPIWYQSAVGPITGNRFDQPLFRYTFGPTGATGTQVGSVELIFSNDNNAQFNWQLDGAAGSEPFTFFGGGGGRSGLWFPPADSGWGLSAFRVGSALVTTVYYYAGGQPRWAQGVGSDTGSTQTIDMITVQGNGLCPSCGGGSSQPPPSSSAGTITLRIQTAGATTGTLRTDISSSIGSWIRPNQSISKLAD